MFCMLCFIVSIVSFRSTSSNSLGTLFTISMKSDFKLQPPTRKPSMSRHLISSGADLGLTEPPYIILVVCAMADVKLVKSHFLIS